jgi:hypothetical protein
MLSYHKLVDASNRHHLVPNLRNRLRRTMENRYRHTFFAMAAPVIYYGCQSIFLKVLFCQYSFVLRLNLLN